MHSNPEQGLERLQCSTWLSVPNTPAEVLYKRQNFGGSGRIVIQHRHEEGPFRPGDANVVSDVNMGGAYKKSCLVLKPLSYHVDHKALPTPLRIHGI